MKPDSPEYQEAYQKELQRLEAEAGKKDDKTDKVDAADKTTTTTSTTDKAKAETIEVKSEIDPETKARFEKVEKALKDTQRWGHESAAKVKKLERELEEKKRQEALSSNELLKANPTLADTIKQVAGVQHVEKPAQEVWLETVARAIPDVNDLLGDQSFYAKAEARRNELGSEWDDPLIAIRELSSLKVTHQSAQHAAVAVEAARKDFEAKAKKKGAMEVPGGSGGKDAAAQGDDAVKRYATMSTAEFAKERSRVMGY